MEERPKPKERFVAPTDTEEGYVPDRNVYIFTSAGVRYTMSRETLISDPPAGDLNFVTPPDRVLAVEMLRLAAENQRLKAALDGTTPALAKERQKAVDDFLRALRCVLTFGASELP